ncbi:MvaI/BcnI restriction endonuclease family protein [Patescibacteria group bacterium]|nr:MvaI/BcnI restriction endonuclease family protein [Patescibacteria group bacterium]
MKKNQLVTFTKASLTVKLKEIAKRGWIKNARHGNHGGVGNTLEDLLGIEENNLPIPNAAEWELKTHRIGSPSLITLLHSEPSPRAIRFVPQVLLPKYGWKHQQAGKKYPKTEKSFRQTISGSSRSDRGFMVNVDRKEQKIYISFDASKVDPRHAAWLKKVEKSIGLGELNPQPYWGFQDLEHAVGSKLLNSFFVQAEVKKEKGRESYRYAKITMLKGFDISCLLKAIEAGDLYVDFDARTGHNHGTKFRMREAKLPELYKEIKIIL